jgi:hypothetical protein
VTLPMPRERGQRWAVLVGRGISLSSPGWADDPDLFGPFFSMEQAAEEAGRWNREHPPDADDGNPVRAWAWPMGSLKALREHDP